MFFFSFAFSPNYLGLASLVLYFHLNSISFAFISTQHTSLSITSLHLFLVFLQHTFSILILLPLFLCTPSLLKTHLSHINLFFIILSTIETTLILSLVSYFVFFSPFTHQLHILISATLIIYSIFPSTAYNILIHTLL